ncbi:MAG: agmatinase family protein [Candidatus Peregrinibacteria bacterium]|nr:agmatinase family protein [Candidatus Peregrinibacteria bacterium]MCB9807675.1 agmatinase family protein [Candidatus Peribacteria bacterium]
MSCDFDQNGAAKAGSGIFGFPYNEEISDLILIPVPWEATCSYGGGTSKAPAQIFEASMYVELFDSDFKDFYKKGIYCQGEDADLKALSQDTQKLAMPIIDAAGILDSELSEKKECVDQACETMNQWVIDKTDTELVKGKKIGLIGGDHSIAFGAIKRISEGYNNLGVLQIDAHSDLRTEFENLKYSHASVFNNVLNETSIEKLVQVGVRGYCQEEADKVNNSNGRVKTFYESYLSEKLLSGSPWEVLCNEIIATLPHNVYISFDIDGLDPSNCPNSGTPMPGGISYAQAIFLLRTLSQKRNIVGFDLVEVSCGKNGETSWDAIVGANLLYKLCGCILQT